MDVIGDAYKALKELEEEGITVRQGWYDESVQKTHVTLWNLGETTEAGSDDEEEVESYPIQITVFSKSDQNDLIERIKKLMRKAGYTFTGRSPDDAKPQQGIYVQAVRFNKIQEV